VSKRKAPARRGNADARINVQRFTGAREVTSVQIARAALTVAGDRPIRRINIGLFDDVGMSDLHAQYMGDPSPTDVLTFDSRDDGHGLELEGDIAVGVDVARRQARQWGASVKEELLRYVIHGVLHLLGYDDDVPARQRRMRREEDRVLALLRGEGRRS
jgi:probable rRNA maturation factor